MPIPHSTTHTPRRWLVGLLALCGALASLGGGAASASSGGAAAPAEPGTAPSTLAPQGVVFPINGPHSYGQGFGASRKSHTHQGQDVMAVCGTPLLAAVSGRIMARRRHSLAGNYIVLRGAGTKQDYFYAHLARPAMVAKGQSVSAGQQIGIVGRSGHATACHLHFELWVAPGWYRGGRPINPLGTLRAWDALS